jgi:hypothetical protein
LDTGANSSAIDLATAYRLNLKKIKATTIEGSAGVIAAENVRVKTICVGQAKRKNLSVTKRNLSGSVTPPNQHLDGILGTDFLSSFIISIDFKNKLISFLKNIPDNFSKGISMEMDNGIPRIRALVNDSVITFFRYDSGASLFDTDDIYLNTTTAVFENIQKADSLLKPVFFLSATGVGGAMRLPVYKLSSAKLKKWK